MKNKSLIKRLIVIGILISVLVLIPIGYGFGFFKHFVFLYDKDFRNIYGITCENTNIYSQRVAAIEVKEDAIVVTLKLNLPTYLFTYYEVSADNFYSAINIYKELSKQYADKRIYVSTGEVGSSYPDCIIDGGHIEMAWSKKADNPECSVSFYDALRQIMLTDNIHAITYESWITTDDYYQFDTITKELPANNSITYLKGSSGYTDNFSAITSFKGLKELDLSFVGDNNIVSDLSFLNELPELENLTITADSMRIDFSDVSHNAVKSFTLHTDESSQEFESKLSDAFPNAEISVVCK